MTHAYATRFLNYAHTRTHTLAVGIIRHDRSVECVCVSVCICVLLVLLLPLAAYVCDRVSVVSKNQF